jgi:hypothetical protein
MCLGGDATSEHAVPNMNGPQKHSPGGHTLQNTCPSEALWFPPGHTRRSPPIQYSPGAHTAVPTRVVAGAGPSGVEYQPGATGTGAPEPTGQYTDTLPQGSAALDTEPGGQKKPAVHGPEQESLVSPEVEPNRPGRASAPPAPPPAPNNKEETPRQQPVTQRCTTTQIKLQISAIAG